MARSTRRTRAVIGSVVAAALVAAAMATSIPGAGAARQVRGFDGTTIKLAGIGIAAQFAEAGTAAEARIKRFNDKNELKGIKIQWAGFADDKQDPATALSEARRLVTQEQVFAITADTSQFNPGDYWTAQHVPYFGWGFDATYCTNKPSTKIWAFSFTGCLLNPDPSFIPDNAQNSYKLVSEKTGKKQPTIAMVGNDSTSSKTSLKFQQLSYTKAGFKVVSADNSMPLPPVSDYTPYVQTALTADNGKAPDAIYCFLSTDCIPVYQQIKANNYPGTYISSLYSELLTKTMSGSYAGIFFYPPDQKTAGLEQMKADFEAEKPGFGAQVSSAKVAGYGSTDMFIQALKTVAKKGKSAITPEAVQKVAATQTWQIKGLSGPVKYPNSTVTMQPYCTSIVNATDAGWVQAQPYACSSKIYPYKG
jgi:ABC-type branched-subunit amino acid transport system substrate-binding protein